MNYFHFIQTSLTGRAKGPLWTAVAIACNKNWGTISEDWSSKHQEKRSRWKQLGGSTVQLHIYKAQEHVFGLRRCRAPWCYQFSTVFMFFVCRSVERRLTLPSANCGQSVGNMGNLWILESSSLSLWRGHWELYVDSGVGFQLFSGELVHTQCLGGGDSRLPYAHPSQPFARSFHAKRREAIAVSFWVNWRQGLSPEEPARS